MKRYFVSTVIIIFSIVLPFDSVAQSKEIARLKMINFSPYIKPGQNPKSRTKIPESQIILLLDSLKLYTEGIRTYGTTDGLEKIPPLAKERKLKVYAGIVLGSDTVVNREQITAGIKIAGDGYADKLIVGNEVLLRNELPASKIIDYLKQVKKACPNIPISYADITSRLIENPDILDNCDFIAVNNYPFWESVSIDCAIKSFHQSYLALLAKTKGKPVFISETGWKTEGASLGEAVPSVPNAVRYLKELLNWSKSTGVEAGIFSAFDEPWKLPNDYGWGIFSNTGVLKKGMEVIFDPITKIDTSWLCSKLNLAGTDTIRLDNVPPYGNTIDVLKGRVNLINPCDYQVGCYIKVGNGWWTKPTFTQPAVPVQCDGRWTLDFTTGGYDHQATAIYVFLIPKSYIPPACSGCATLPSDIYKNAISAKSITRWVTGTFINDQAGEIICYPNPVTNGEVTFKINGSALNEKFDLTILESSGRILKYYTELDLANPVSVMDFSAGVYHCLLTSKNSVVTYSFRIIIARNP